ncbi:MAG: hypothetical protein V1494_08305 [Candidatus Diapherotrites archaeon]
MKNVRAIFSPEAEEVFRYLNREAANSKTERTILNAVKSKIGLIKANIHYGDPIGKDLIPKEYKEKYGINNLFRVELPNYWRMLYSLTNDENKIEIIAFILDLINHDQYNKKFGYKKK